MQPNQLTLNVDITNDENVVVEVYERSNEYQDRSTYIGENHALDARDQIQLYRTYPTKSGNFKGVQKSSVKFTKDQAVSGADGVTTLTAPLIIDVSFSVPVGTSAAEILAARQRAIALLDSDNYMDPLNIQLLV
jgi:hypothetical protein